jgi:hypothetical protein
LVEDIAPIPHLRSECPYPDGFLRVLLPVIQFLFCVPRYVPSLERCFAICLGERLGTSQLVPQLLLFSSIVFPTLVLHFLPCGFGASVILPIRGEVGLGR